VSVRGEKGVAALEFALILPLLLVMVFGIIDIGRLIQARLIITNVSREGGSVSSRYPIDVTMLQESGKPLDLNGSGRIYISKISAGNSQSPYPAISRLVDGAGNLPEVSSSIQDDFQYLGLSKELYDHLVFNSEHQTSDISEVTVVEVYYGYTPITPLPRFISGILSSKIVSKAVF
jgi:hypothetical protein